MKAACPASPTWSRNCALLTTYAREHPDSPNHVLFSHCLCCCGPHPALFWGNPFTGNPFTGNPFTGNPFTGNPFTGNPFTGNPFTGNPFTGNPFTGNPFTGNPYGAKDYQPNPLALLSHAKCATGGHRVRGNRLATPQLVRRWLPFCRSPR